MTEYFRIKIHVMLFFGKTEYFLQALNALSNIAINALPIFQIQSY